MLIHTRDFLSATNLTDRLHYLFLVVPLPCVTNSRYMAHEHLVSMMKSIGYSHLIHHHFSNKLAYYLFKLNGKPPLKNVLWKKKMITGKQGGGHNNFSVVIE
jgi:25S rRNA (adenine2142-N1)-methyltransferase